MYKICMNCGKKYDLSEKKCPKRKCPVCGGKIETQYTEEEMREIQKQNDDMVVINTLLMQEIYDIGKLDNKNKNDKKQILNKHINSDRAL